VAIIIVFRNEVSDRVLANAFFRDDRDLVEILGALDVARVEVMCGEKFAVKRYVVIGVLDYPADLSVLIAL
jgi:hypothetical protein